MTSGFGLSAGIRADLKRLAERQQLGKVRVRVAAKARHDSFKVGTHVRDGVCPLLVQRPVFHKVGNAAGEQGIARCQTHAIDFFTGALVRESSKVVRIPGALDFSSAHHKCTLTPRMSREQTAQLFASRARDARGLEAVVRAHPSPACPAEATKRRITRERFQLSRWEHQTG